MTNETEEDDLSLGDGCGFFLLMLALLPVNVISRGYVIATLWGWHMFPTFGVGFGVAEGSAMVIAFQLLRGVDFMHFQIDTIEKKMGIPDHRPDKIFRFMLSHTLGLPLMGLGAGWLLLQLPL